MRSSGSGGTVMRSSGSSNGGGADDGGEVLLDHEYKEEYVRNSRGMRLFACTWLPGKRRTPKALVFLCHGYAVECGVTMRGTGERLARAGYAVYGLDYEGHGRSDGLQGYVPDFELLVRDCDGYFTSVVRRSQSQSKDDSKPRFLLGESMGGAVALLLHLRRPEFWSGAVLVAPMCKIADDMRPHPLVVNILRAMTSIIPTWKIVPSNDVIDAAYKTQEKRDEIRGNPYCYKDKPRLKTAYELLKVSLDLEQNLLHQVSLPFLIVHGGADKVTDPSVSELLYRSAASHDKTLKLYPGMWHALTSGESPDNIHAVFQDIIAWLDHRSSDTDQQELLSEVEQKARHDDQHHHQQHGGNK
ncbi:caffeoylshikimate esterase-like isoform X2 [Miscanthus floridulus]|uniref:caffeoylshikimate esterase-like isoform X2 n=2 Tax=Miscanthus floridulus TaxID=154761 RepID=UPI00345A1B97